MQKYIHNIVLDENTYVHILESKLVQWNYGQVLRIQGNLPSAVEIHFSLQESGGVSKTRIGVTKDGITEVVIPEFIVETENIQPYKAYAFIYISDREHGTTVHKIVMNVDTMPEPEAHNTPDEGDLFHEAIEAVNEAAKRSEDSSKRSESYAVGGTGTRLGEDTDNAKYYSGQAKQSEDVVGLAKDEVLKAKESVVLSEKNVNDAEGRVNQKEQSVNKTAGNVEKLSQQVTKDKEQVAGDKGEIISLKNTVVSSAEQVSRDKAEVEENKDFVNKAKQYIDRTTEQFGKDATNAISSVKTEGTKQVGVVLGEGAKQVKFVTDVGVEQTGIVTAEGTKQTGVVKSEGEKWQKEITENGKSFAKNDDLMKLAIKPTVSGNPIVTKDSADFPAVSLELGGSTTQVQTTGKNLLNAIPKLSEYTGITVKTKKDKTFVIDGTPVTQYEPIFMNIPIVFKANGNHVFWLSVVDKKVMFRLNKQDKLTGEKTSEYFYKSSVVNVNKEKYNYELTLQTAEQFAFANYNVGVMVYAGEDLTLPYEPYTSGEPSPSPNYPQEIVQGEWDRVSDTGKNLWDEQWISSEGYVESKNYIPVPLNTKLRFTAKPNGFSNGLIEYNSNFEEIAKQWNDKPITTSPETRYLKFRMGKGYGIEYLNDICIMLYDSSTDGEYEPYKGFAKTLPEKIQLSKWDKIKLIDGVWKVERNSYKCYNIENENIKRAVWLSKPIYYFIKTNLIKNAFTEDAVYCNMLQTNTKGITDSFDDFSFGKATKESTIYFKLNDTFDTVEKIKQWLIGRDLYFYYQTETPTYEVLPPEAQDLLNRIVTYYPNTVLSTNEGITLDLQYIADTKNYIDEQHNKDIAELQALILER